MKRRQFINIISLLGISLTACPLLSFKQSIISNDELIGKGNPGLYGENFKLREEAHLAFLNMQKAALEDDINIKIVSSYRNFKHQKRIWENKYKQFTNSGLNSLQAIKKIIEYSTIPGTSRHHWGTDIDIIDAYKTQPKKVLQVHHYEQHGIYSPLKVWMEKNAHIYGYYLVYTNSETRKGFQYEPWHYSYKPLSQIYLKHYQNLNLSEILKKERVLGSNFFSDPFLKTYIDENILDINPELL